MRTVKVLRPDLLEKIKENRDKHKETFNDALEGFKLEVIERLEEMLQEAREGKKYRASYILKRPEDHTKDYDRVIKMLEMSIEKEIEISENEFQQYVMDEWHWKDDFMISNSVYLAKVGK